MLHGSLMLTGKWPLRGEYWVSGLPDRILLAFSCSFLDWSCLDLENIPPHPRSKWLTMLSLKEDGIILKTSFPSRTWKGCRGIHGGRGGGREGNDSRQGVCKKKKNLRWGPWLCKWSPVPLGHLYLLQNDEDQGTKKRKYWYRRVEL